MNKKGTVEGEGQSKERYSRRKGGRLASKEVRMVGREEGKKVGLEVECRKSASESEVG